MSTPDEIVKQAEEQQRKAEDAARHQAQDLRKLDKSVGPDEEARSTEENTDPVTAQALEQNQEAEPEEKPKVRRKAND